MNKPAIVIASYNRPDATQRLLDSLAKADYSGYDNIDLIISIDGCKDLSDPASAKKSEDVLKTATEFNWAYGQKRIIEHPNNLGLKLHILSCGDLTGEYGSIILLEDDVIVSPYFYDYAVKALRFYSNENKIAQISLYNYRHCESANLPFSPINNGYDTYFMQVPSSWGEIWTAQQWSGFRLWLKDATDLTPADKLPEYVKNWGAKSWKKWFYKYMVDEDLYTVYPYLALSSNWGDAGEHLPVAINSLQVELQLFKKKSYNFCTFDKSLVCYDAYYDICLETLWKIGIMPHEDYVIDLMGTKQLSLFDQPHWFTIKKCNNAIRNYPLLLLPLERNLSVSSDKNGPIRFAEKNNLSNEISENSRNAIHQLTSIHTYWYVTAEVERNTINAMRNTLEFRLGTALLRPYRKIKKIINRIIN